MHKAAPIALVVMIVLARAVAAQVAPRGTAVTGSILDAASNEPLVYAAVTLEPNPAGALPGGGASVRQTRVVLSDTAGRYRFEQVMPGDYRLHVQRTGYRSRSLDVRVRAESDAHISVGLQVEPVALDPVNVPGGPAGRTEQSYARRARDPDDVLIADALRTSAERLRQRTYLSSDVRVITHADVLEGISLGETDLFRALQRLPGVGAVDDWSAELLTRGAPWDQTRIYFDGLPLFNALHALGMFAGVNADAVGAAFLHPGVQPVALGGAAAGALDIRSRSGAAEFSGVGELSLASARLALDQRRDNGSAWMIAARRSYVDLATRALSSLIDEDGHVPYMFLDVAARGDVVLGAATSLELSGLLTRDNAYGEIIDILEQTRASWGGRAARATLTTPLAGLSTRHTIGYSGYGSTIRDVPGSDPFTRPRAGAARNRLHYTVLRGELQAAPGDWSAGYELARHEVSYRGRHPASADMVELMDSLAYRSNLDVGSLWAQRRLDIGNVVVADIGARVEGGSRVAGRGSLAFAPRLSVRAQLGATTASAAYGRVWQHTQALTPTGITAVNGFASDFLWLVSSDSVPALKSDLFTAGVERWLGDQWIVALNGYVRRASGVTIPDPRPGDLVDRPLHVTADNRADGVELSMRRLTGRWTGSAAYTFGRAALQYGELSFTAPFEQRHTLDATIAGRIARSWRVGAAYTGASGTPFTRRWEGRIVCDTAACVTELPPRQESPNAERRRAHHSVDVSVEWVRRYRSWHFEAFLQLRNVLNRNNQGRYVRTVRSCFARCGMPDEHVVEMDEFLPALPVLPLLGARISF